VAGKALPLDGKTHRRTARHPPYGFPLKSTAERQLLGQDRLIRRTLKSTRSFNRLMKAIELVVNGEAGFLFEAEVSEALVFVPISCVELLPSGKYLIDQTQCFLSGWAHKSMRFSNTEDNFDLVFPVAERPVTNRNDQRVKMLIKRLSNAYDVVAAVGPRGVE
jgi:hypothetical protein